MDCSTHVEQASTPGRELGDELAIWAGCLGSYNAGHLRGRWLFLDEYGDAEELGAAIQAILEETGNTGGDWFIADYNAFPKGCTSNEWPDLGALIEFSELHQEHSEHDGWEAACYLASGHELTSEWIGEVRELLEDHYMGSFDTPEDMAAELLEGTGELNEIPERLRYYFDYAAYARDLLCGDVREDGRCYFWNH